MYSDNFIKTTEAEIAFLRKKKAELTAEIDESIRTLECILMGMTVTVQGKPESGSESLGIDPNDGLTVSIEKVLANAPGGLRPMQVSEVLLALGFTVNGNTRLQDRVAGEMARLRRDGRLVKTEDGLYRLASQ